MERRLVRWFAAAVAALIGAAPGAAARQPDGVLQLQVVDAETDEPLPARIELTDARGRTVRPKGWGLAPLGKHAYLAPATRLGLHRGAYRFLIDAGPEYRTQRGHFEIDRHAEDTERTPMRRFANMAEEGWVGVDLQSQRVGDDIAVVRQVERLAAAPTLTHQWDGKAWRATGAQGAVVGLWQDERGAVWLYDADGALSADDLPDLSATPATRLAEARRRGFRVVADPQSAELPVWIALDAVDALLLIDGLAEDNYDAGIDRMRAYYAVLNAGERLPPVGGSASGVQREATRRKLQVTRPLGDGRTWVRGEADATLAELWSSIELGQVVVSNGPLLRPTANGRQPGATLAADADALIGLNLATRDRVDYLEIIADGQIVLTVRLSDWAASGGRLDPVPLAGKRWIAVRAITNTEDRLQMAHSGPWYVDSEIDCAKCAIKPMLIALEAAAERWAEAEPEAYQAAQSYWSGKLGGE